MARTPTLTKDGSGANYGFMNWYLNDPATRPDGSKPNPMYPSVPRSVVAFQGNGSNLIYIDWVNDLVVVVRWISRGSDEFFGKVVSSLR